jgi:hypothetical protein
MVEIRYLHQLLLVAVVVADRGNRVPQVRWTMEELEVELAEVVVVDLIQATGLIVVNETTAAEELTDKAIQAAQEFDLMPTLKILTKVAAAAVQVAQEQVLRTVASVIVLPLEEIKLPEVLAVQLTY